MNRDEQIQRLTSFVERQEMTPVEADEFAVGAGLTPLEGQNWPVTLTDTHWPLAFAISWISWRNPDKALEQWGRFRCWAGHLWRDPQHEKQVEGYGEAEVEVWQALQAGKVHAIGLPYQEGDTVEIPPIQWRNLEWMPGFGKISIRNFGHAEARYRCVEVDRSEVQALWPAQDEITQNADPSPNPALADNGGSKLGLVIQALRRMHTEKPASKTGFFSYPRSRKWSAFKFLDRH